MSRADASEDNPFLPSLDYRSKRRGEGYVLSLPQSLPRVLVQDRSRETNLIFLCRFKALNPDQDNAYFLQILHHHITYPEDLDSSWYTLSFNPRVGTSTLGLIFSLKRLECRIGIQPRLQRHTLTRNI